MEAVELTDQTIRNLTPEQMQILVDLGEIAVKKLNLNAKIEQITEVITGQQKTVGFVHSDEPKGLHEDPEIATVVTIKERYKVVNVNRQVAGLLQRAVDLGMAHLAFVQRQAKVYGVPLPNPAS